MARKTGVDLADKLTDDAIGGFKAAHEKLTRANEILLEERENRKRDAEEWRKEIEDAIARAEAEAQEHEDKLAKNARVIGKLSELI